MSAWPAFTSENPDFTVRSAIDGSSFQVERAALLKSEVFRDMFECCDSSESEPLELHEASGELSALLRLLHDPPAKPTEIPQREEQRFQPVQYNPQSIIPLPLLLSILFPLTDKYAVDDEFITSSLRAHLLSNAQHHPLEVYGFATIHSFHWEASSASQFVLPIDSYSLKEVAAIPTVNAYHKIVKLQAVRVKGMRDLLFGEEIFPRGYGECTSHSAKTRATWDNQRKALIGRIECVSDIAGEMDGLTQSFETCQLCHKAWIAAVEMLRYKVYRLPRRLDQMPQGF